MNIDDDIIPWPIRFNPFKHHRNYILELLKGAPTGLLLELMATVNNNYIDIYYGTMTPGAIGQSVINLLQSVQVFHEEDFTLWVNTNNGFRQITLEDQSHWIVRRSNEKERYIHLHPSRTGAFSIRFKGSTLKTICLLKSNFIHSREDISLELVNSLRKQAGLSPVKDLDRSSGIIQGFEKFFSPKL